MEQIDIVKLYLHKFTALHTTVGPHLCCDNWKGQRLREFRLLIPINSKQNRRQRDLYLFGFVGLFKICFSFIL